MLTVILYVKSENSCFGQTLTAYILKIATSYTANNFISLLNITRWNTCTTFNIILHISSYIKYINERNEICTKCHLCSLHCIRNICGIHVMELLINKFIKIIINIRTIKPLQGCGLGVQFVIHYFYYLTNRCAYDTSAYFDNTQ